MAFNHKGVKLIVGGWSFFIAENLILSQNREAIVQKLGSEKKYLACYGALSTFACASVASGFFSHGIRQGPMVPWKGSKLSYLTLPL